MVNPVNSPRVVAELGARNEEASARIQIPVQDVRKEAARLVERHKRRITEDALMALPCSVRPTDGSRGGSYVAGKGEQAPAGPSPESGAGPGAGARSNSGAEIALRAPAAMSGKIAAALESATAGAAESGTVAVDGVRATVSELERDVVQPTAPFHGTENEDIALPQRSSVATLSNDGLPRQPSQTATSDARGQAVPMPVHSAPTPTPASTLAHSEATVFDVPLRGLGPQHSTRVSLHLASGQVILSPSTERAVEVLANAALGTSWVSVDDSSDQRERSRHERDPDEEEGQ
jgi:hypothetical protein